jgi:hypothetical protein
MAKLTLSSLGSFSQSAITTINDNMDAIETAMEKTLSRDGTTPNTMTADLDMDENNILNVNTLDVATLIVDGITISTLAADAIAAAAAAELAADEAEAAATAAAADQVEIEAAIAGWDALTIGTVTTLAAGAPATVANVGTPGEVILDFGIPQGEVGASGAGTGDVVGPASATNNGFVKFDGTSGTLIKDSAATIAITDGGTGATTAGAAFTALKQAASDTATGVVELATDAEVQTGTDTTRAITAANLTAKEASVANFRADTADRILTTDVVYDAAAEVTLTDAATIAVDMSTFINAVVTLADNRAMGNPTNEKPGTSGCIRIVQDATGSRTLSYGTDWEFAGGTAPVLTTTAAATDLLFYYVIAANRVFGNLIKAVA